MFITDLSLSMQIEPLQNRATVPFHKRLPVISAVGDLVCHTIPNKD